MGKVQGSLRRLCRRIVGREEKEEGRAEKEEEKSEGRKGREREQGFRSQESVQDWQLPC